MFAMQIFIMSQQIKAENNGRMIDKGALDFTMNAFCGSGGSVDAFCAYFSCCFIAQTFAQKIEKIIKRTQGH